MLLQLQTYASNNPYSVVEAVEAPAGKDQWLNLQEGGGTKGSCSVMKDVDSAHGMALLFLFQIVFE